MSGRIIDRAFLSQFRQDFEQVSQLFLEKQGVRLSIGNISFDSAQAHTRLEIRVVDADTGVPTGSKYENECLRRALTTGPRALPIANVPAEIIGSEVEATDCNRYKIVGYNSRAPKYCVMLESTATGRRSRASSGFIKRFIAC